MSVSQGCVVCECDGEGLSIYVHIPFCDYKCTFCDFATYTGQAPRRHAYVDALIRELELRAAAHAIPPARTIFFGGGTPSILPAREIRRILDAVDRVAGIRPQAEITTESNPDTLSDDQCHDLRRAGITRLSIGIQTLNQSILTAVNRRHTADQALRAIVLALAAGFPSVGADLMFGLPGQDLADWRATLDAVLRARPQHLSIYGLIVEPGTLLRRQIERRTVTLPSDDAAADMYEYARDVMRANDYVHYEISNWARPGHQSCHNLTYWRHRPYLGLGLSAHSYYRGQRFANVRGLQNYLARLEQGRLPTAACEDITPERARADAIMLGLRLIEGIHVPAFDARFGGRLVVDHAATIERFAALGLLEVADDHLRLTPRGYLLANQVWQAFI